MKKYKMFFLSLLLIALLYVPNQILALQIDSEDIQFLIHGDEIASFYDEEEVLLIVIPEKLFEEDLSLVQKDEEHEDGILIENAVWEKKNRSYTYEILCPDADNLQYEIITNHGDCIASSPRFTIDSKAPVFSIYADEEVLLNKKVYLSKPAHLNMMISDDHLDLEASMIQLYYGNEPQEIDWENDRCIASYDLHDDGTYSILGYGKDHLQHICEERYEIIVDQVEPDVIFQVNGDVINSQIYEKDVAVLDLQVNEVNFDEEASCIMIDGTDVDIEWEHIEGMWYGRYIIEEHGLHEVTYHIQDKAGNVSENSSSNFVFVDGEAPKVSLEINNELCDNTDSYYADRVTIQLNIKEEYVEENNSYIKINESIAHLSYDKELCSYYYTASFTDGTYLVDYHIEDKAGHISEKQLHLFCVDSINPELTIYQNVDNRYTSEDVSIQLELKEEHIDIEKDAQITCIWNGEKLELDQNWKQEDDVYFLDLFFQKEGIFDLYIDIEDRSGNHFITEQGIKEMHWIIDKTAPEVQIIPSQTQSYVKDGQRVIVEIKENNLDLDNTVVSWWKDGEKVFPDAEIIEDGNIMRIQYFIHEDGSYQLDVCANDLARYEVQESYAFVIDTNAPDITLQGLYPALHSRKDIVFDVNISDENLSYYRIHFIDANAQDHVLHEGRDSNYRYVFSVAEKSVIEGLVYVEAYDMAGNAAISSEIDFVIDKKDPEITILMNGMKAEQEMKYYLNRDVHIEITWYDDYIKENSIHLYKNGQPISAICDENTCDIMIKAQKNVEDAYIVHVEVEDTSGNRKIEEIAFVVDTCLPVLTFDDDVFHNLPYAGSWQPHLKQEQEDFWIFDYTLLKNQMLIPYTWGDVIEEDGNYQLDVYVIDQANNIAKLDEPFTFTIDKTSPVIQLWDDTRQEEVKQTTISMTPLKVILRQEDMEKCLQETMTRITINGKEINLSMLQRDENQQMYYRFFPENGMNTIYASAVDAAGNMTEKKWEITVTDYDAEILRNLSSIDMKDSVSAVFAISILIIIIAGFGGVLYWKRKNGR